MSLVIVRFIKFNMYKQKQHIWPFGNSTARAFFGSLAVIMFLLPNFVFAAPFQDFGTVFGVPFVVGTTYQNPSSDRNMYVIISGSSSSGPNIFMRVGSSTPLASTNRDYTSICLAGAGVTCTIWAVVPPSNYFQFTGAGTPSAGEVDVYIDDSTLSVSVDNDDQNVFNGILLFFLSMVFIVWYFRGRLIR